MGREILARLEKRYRIAPDEFAPLNFKDPFLMLVSIILSQNTSDRNALRATMNLIAAGLNSPESILKAGRKKVEQLIRVSGIYRRKADTIINVAKWALEKHNGDLTELRKLSPERVRNELTGINGVGEKTADVFIGFYMGAKTFPVDTHVRRVAMRLGLAAGTYSEIKERLMEVFDEPMKAHMLLIKHGRETCRARNPGCDRCVLNDLCKYYRSKS
ncbi:MAG: endonuclease III domain-containing protein [Nitrososphaeria archaeon]